MAINWYRNRKSIGASASLYERKLAKINLRIEKLASKGKDNYIEYSKLVDELVEKGDYSALEQSLFYYYGIDLTDIQSVSSIKKSTWDEICYQTYTPFQKKLKLMYDKAQVYQTAHDIYSSREDYVQIGISNPLSSEFTQTPYSQSFDLLRVDDIVYMKVINNNLNYVSIERAEWVASEGVEIPINKSYIQDFFVGTESNQKDPETLIKIEIPTSVMREYVIYTEEIPNLLLGYTYSDSLVTSSSTSSLIWNTHPIATGYVLNISTYSSFDYNLPNYTSVGFPTFSTTDYVVDGFTVSLTLYGLDNNFEHYYSVRNSVGAVSGSSSTSGTTFSVEWSFNVLADSYSLDISTYSNFISILPGYNFILGTISTIPNYITGSTNSYVVSGLTSGTYYYRVRYLFDEQTGSFFTSQPTGIAEWPISDIAVDYQLDVSKSSTFSSISQSFRTGTVSNDRFSIISGTSGSTASYILDLDTDETYYYRIRIYKGLFINLNYKVILDKNAYLGMIIEREIYTPDSQYLVQNRQYARLVGARKTFLEVYKVDPGMSSGFATASIFAFDDLTYTEDTNLLTRYTQAINYLNS